MTFTISEKLKIYFRKDQELLGETSQLVNKVLRYGFKNMNTSKEYTLEIIVVIHTFEKDLKWNPSTCTCDSYKKRNRKNKWMLWKR